MQRLFRHCLSLTFLALSLALLVFVEPSNAQDTRQDTRIDEILERIRDDDTDDEIKSIEEKILRDAKETIDKAIDSDFSAGKAAADRYKKDGEMWGQKYTDEEIDGYKEHPWRRGRPQDEWWKDYTENDLDAMGWWKSGAHKSIFYNTCFSFHRIDCCVHDPLTGVCLIDLVGYWWPEAMVDLGDYCIGSHIGPSMNVAGFEFDFQGGCLDDWLDKKKAYDLETQTQVEAAAGGIAAEFPDGLRNDNDFLGHSHNDDTGFLAGEDYRTYEAHLFRPFIDVLQGELARTLSPLLAHASAGYLGELVRVPRLASALNPRNENCFSQACLPLNKEVLFPTHWTEDMDVQMPGGKVGFPFFWRHPERSRARFDNANGFYQFIWTHDAPGDIIDNAIRPGGAGLPGSLSALQNDTCSSWRAADAAPLFYGWRYPMDLLRDPKAPLDINKLTPEKYGLLSRNCLTSQGTQIYPLVGAIQSNSERVGVVGAVRRMLEWASWDGFPYNNKINHFADYPLNFNLARAAHTDFYIPLPGMMDKLQRVYPLDEADMPSRCFNMREVDSIHNPDLWPKGINAENWEGTTRFAFWNYRTCCVRLSKLQGFNDAPTIEEPSACFGLTE